MYKYGSTLSENIMNILIIRQRIIMQKNTQALIVSCILLTITRLIAMEPETTPQAQLGFLKAGLHEQFVENRTAIVENKIAQKKYVNKLQDGPEAIFRLKEISAMIDNDEYRNEVAQKLLGVNEFVKEAMELIKNEPLSAAMLKGLEESLFFTGNATQEPFCIQEFECPLIYGVPREAYFLQFSPNANLLAGITGTSIYIWDIAASDYKVVNSLILSGSLQAISFSPEGTYLAALEIINSDQNIHVIDVAKLSCTRIFSFQQCSYGSIGWDSNRRIIFKASFDAANNQDGRKPYLYACDPLTGSRECVPEQDRERLEIFLVKAVKTSGNVESAIAGLYFYVTPAYRPKNLLGKALSGLSAFAQNIHATYSNDSNYLAAFHKEGISVYTFGSLQQKLCSNVLKYAQQNNAKQEIEQLMQTQIWKMLAGGDKVTAALHATARRLKQKTKKNILLSKPVIIALAAATTAGVAYLVYKLVNNQDESDL